MKLGTRAIIHNPPEDNSIVYAISANYNNLKGTLVDAYVCTQKTLPEMARKLRVEKWMSPKRKRKKFRTD